MPNPCNTAGPLATAACAVVLAGALSTPSFAADSGDAVTDFIEAGNLLLNVRYRYENVDQGGIAEEAEAHTIRTRFGFETGTYDGFQFLLEFENVLALGGENYNNTLNGKTQFPIVKDPETTEVNRFHVSYELPLDSVVTVGRQRHLLDDRRWVGNAGFRQNETTFDSIRLDNTTIDDLTATYIYVFSSHRALGDDAPQGDLNMNTHLANVAYEGFAVGRIAVYGYLVDLDEIPSQSSMTFGARLTGSQDVGSDLSFLYAAEYAHQSDYGNSPTGFGLNYVLLEPGLRYRTVVVKIGYALLGGNGNRGVQSPLASRHGKQGWADQFTSTPGNGIRDLYGSITYTVDGFGIVDGTELTAAYHDFDADNTSADYGEELDLQISKTVFDRVTLAAIFAHYEADTFRTDVDKFWLALTFQL